MTSYVMTCKKTGVATTLTWCTCKHNPHQSGFAFPNQWSDLCYAHLVATFCHSSICCWVAIQTTS